MFQTFLVRLFNVKAQMKRFTHIIAEIRYEPTAKL